MSPARRPDPATGRIFLDRGETLDFFCPLLGFDPTLPMMKAIGVPELSAYLRGEIALDAAIADAKTATRHYIKRQLTWWRGQSGWHR